MTFAKCLSMKVFYLFLVTLFLPAGLAAQSSLEVTVKGIEVQEGNILLALHASDETFPNDEPLVMKAAKAEASNVTIHIHDLPAGEYAISLFHDINDNEELDTNIMGIPKEPFGFSNDAMGMFGAPSFKDSKFVIPPDGNKKISITLKSI